MKTIALPLLLLMIMTAPVLAQQEQGDIELQLTGSYTQTVGNDDFTFALGNFQGKVGYFFTDGLEIGAYPSLTITTTGTGFGGTETTSTLGAGAFLVYSFLSGDGTTVPYFGGQFFKSDLSDDQDQGNAGVNAGVKFFFNRYAAFDVGGTYLFPLEENGLKLILIQAGISFLL